MNKLAKPIDNSKSVSYICIYFHLYLLKFYVIFVKILV